MNAHVGSIGRAFFNLGDPQLPLQQQQQPSLSGSFSAHGSRRSAAGTRTASPVVVVVVPSVTSTSTPSQRPASSPPLSRRRRAQAPPPPPLAIPPSAGSNAHDGCRPAGSPNTLYGSRLERSLAFPGSTAAVSASSPQPPPAPSAAAAPAATFELSAEDAELCLPPLLAFFAGSAALGSTAGSLPSGGGGDSASQRRGNGGRRHRAGGAGGEGHPHRRHEAASRSPTDSDADSDSSADSDNDATTAAAAAAAAHSGSRSAATTATAGGDHRRPFLLNDLVLNARHAVFDLTPGNCDAPSGKSAAAAEAALLARLRTLVAGHHSSSSHNRGSSSNSSGGRPLLLPLVYRNYAQPPLRYAARSHEALPRSFQKGLDALNATAAALSDLATAAATASNAATTTTAVGTPSTTTASSGAAVAPGVAASGADRTYPSADLPSMADLLGGTQSNHSLGSPVVFSPTTGRPGSAGLFPGSPTGLWTDLGFPGGFSATGGAAAGTAGGGGTGGSTRGGSDANTSASSGGGGGRPPIEAGGVAGFLSSVNALIRELVRRGEREAALHVVMATAHWSRLATPAQRVTVAFNHIRGCLPIQSVAVATLAMEAWGALHAVGASSTDYVRVAEELLLMVGNFTHHGVTAADHLTGVVMVRHLLLWRTVYYSGLLEEKLPVLLAGVWRLLCREGVPSVVRELAAAALQDLLAFALERGHFSYAQNVVANAANLLLAASIARRAVGDDQENVLGGGGDGSGASGEPSESGAGRPIRGGGSSSDAARSPSTCVSVAAPPAAAVGITEDMMLPPAAAAASILSVPSRTSALEALSLRFQSAGGGGGGSPRGDFHRPLQQRFPIPSAQPQGTPPRRPSPSPPPLAPTPNQHQQQRTPSLWRRIKTAVRSVVSGSQPPPPSGSRAVTRSNPPPPALRLPRTQAHSYSPPPPRMHDAHSPGPGDLADAAAHHSVPAGASFDSAPGADDVAFSGYLSPVLLPPGAAFPIGATPTPLTPFTPVALQQSWAASSVPTGSFGRGFALLQTGIAASAEGGAAGLYSPQPPLPNAFQRHLLILLRQASDPSVMTTPVASAGDPAALCSITVPLGASYSYSYSYNTTRSTRHRINTNTTTMGQASLPLQRTVLDGSARGARRGRSTQGAGGLSATWGALRAQSASAVHQHQHQHQHQQHQQHHNVSVPHSTPSARFAAALEEAEAPASMNAAVAAATLALGAFLGAWREAGRGAWPVAAPAPVGVTSTSTTTAGDALSEAAAVLSRARDRHAAGQWEASHSLSESPPAVLDLPTLVPVSTGPSLAPENERLSTAAGGAGTTASTADNNVTSAAAAVVRSTTARVVGSVSGDGIQPWAPTTTTGAAAAATALARASGQPRQLRHAADVLVKVEPAASSPDHRSERAASTTHADDSRTVAPVPGPGGDEDRTGRTADTTAPQPQPPQLSAAAPTPSTAATAAPPLHLEMFLPRHTVVALMALCVSPPTATTTTTTAAPSAASPSPSPPPPPVCECDEWPVESQVLLERLLPLLAQYYGAHVPLTAVLSLLPRVISRAVREVKHAELSLYPLSLSLSRHTLSNMTTAPGPSHNTHSSSSSGGTSLLTAGLLLASVADRQPAVFERLFASKMVPLLARTVEHTAVAHDPLAYAVLGLLVHNLPSAACRQRCAPMVETLVHAGLRSMLTPQSTAVMAAVCGVYPGFWGLARSLLLYRAADILMDFRADSADDGAAVAPSSPSASSSSDAAAMMVAVPSAGAEPVTDLIGTAAEACPLSRPVATVRDKRFCFHVLHLFRRGWGGIGFFFLEVCAPYLTHRDPRLRQACVQVCVSLLLSDCPHNRTGGPDRDSQHNCRIDRLLVARRRLAAAYAASATAGRAPRVAMLPLGTDDHLALGDEHRGRTHVAVLRDTLHRLVDVAISDPEERIRRAALCSLTTETFQLLFPHESILNSLFVALNDRSLPNRVQAVRVLRQLAPSNPPAIYPRLRNVLLQQLSDFMGVIGEAERRSSAVEPNHGHPLVRGGGGSTRGTHGGEASSSLPPVAAAATASLRADDLALLAEVAQAVSQSVPLYLGRILAVLRYALCSPTTARDALVTAMHYLTALNEDSPRENWPLFEPFVAIVSQQLCVRDGDTRRMLVALVALQSILQSSEATGYSYEELQRLVGHLHSLLYQKPSVGAEFSMAILKLLGTISSIEPLHPQEVPQQPALLGRPVDAHPLPDLSLHLSAQQCNRQRGGSGGASSSAALVRWQEPDRFSPFSPQLWPDAIVRVLIHAVSDYLSSTTSFTPEGLCECLGAIMRILTETDALHRLDLYLPTLLTIATDLNQSPAFAAVADAVRPLFFSSLERLVSRAGRCLAGMYEPLQRFLQRNWDPSSPALVMHACGLVHALAVALPELLKQHTTLWLTRLLSVLMDYHLLHLSGSSSSSGGGGAAPGSTAAVSRAVSEASDSSQAPSRVISPPLPATAAAPGHSSPSSTAATTPTAAAVQPQQQQQQQSSAVPVTAYFVITATLQCLRGLASPSDAQLVCTNLSQALLEPNLIGLRVLSGPATTSPGGGGTGGVARASDYPRTGRRQMRPSSLFPSTSASTTAPVPDLLSSDRETFAATANRLMTRVLLDYMAQCDVFPISTAIMKNCLYRLNALADAHHTALDVVREQWLTPINGATDSHTGGTDGGGGVRRARPPTRAKLEHRLSELRKRQDARAHGRRADEPWWGYDSPLFRIAFASSDATRRVERFFPFREVDFSWETFAEMDLLACMLYIVGRHNGPATAAATNATGTVQYTLMLTQYMHRRFWEEAFTTDGGGGAADSGGYGHSIAYLVRCATSPFYHAVVVPPMTPEALEEVFQSPTRITEISGSGGGGGGGLRSSVERQTFSCESPGATAAAPSSAMMPRVSSLGTLSDTATNTTAALAAGVSSRNASELPDGDFPAAGYSTQPIPLGAARPAVRHSLPFDLGICEGSWSATTLATTPSPSTSVTTVPTTMNVSMSTPPQMLHPAGSLTTAAAAAVRSAREANDLSVTAAAIGTPPQGRGLRRVATAAPGATGTALDSWNSRCLAQTLPDAMTPPQWGHAERLDSHGGGGGGGTAAAADDGRYDSGAASYTATTYSNVSLTDSDPTTTPPLSADHKGSGNDNEDDDYARMDPLLARFQSHDLLGHDEWRQWFEMLCTSLIESSREVSVKACEQLLKQHKRSLMYSDVTRIAFLSHLLLLPVGTVEGWFVALHGFYGPHNGGSGGNGRPQVPQAIAAEIALLGHTIRLYGRRVFSEEINRTIIDVYMSTDYVAELAHRAMNPSLSLLYIEASLLREGLTWQRIAALMDTLDDLATGMHRGLAAHDPRIRETFVPASGGGSGSAVVAHGPPDRLLVKQAIQPLLPPFMMEYYGWHRDAIKGYLARYPSLLPRARLASNGGEQEEEEDEKEQEEPALLDYPSVLGAMRSHVRLLDFGGALRLWHRVKHRPFAYRGPAATGTTDGRDSGSYNLSLDTVVAVGTAPTPSAATAALMGCDAGLSGPAPTSIARYAGLAAEALARWDVVQEATDYALAAEERRRRRRLTAMTTAATPAGPQEGTAARLSASWVPHGDPVEGGDAAYGWAAGGWESSAAASAEGSLQPQLGIFRAAALVATYRHAEAARVLAGVRRSLTNSYAVFHTENTRVKLELNCMFQQIAELEEGIHAIELTTLGGDGDGPRPDGGVGTNGSGDSDSTDRGGGATENEVRGRIYTDATIRRLRNIACRTLPVSSTLMHRFATIGVRSALVPPHWQISNIFILAEEIEKSGMPTRSVETLGHFAHLRYRSLDVDAVLDYRQQIGLERYRRLARSLAAPAELTELYAAVAARLRHTIAATAGHFDRAALRPPQQPGVVVGERPRLVTTADLGPGGLSRHQVELLIVSVYCRRRLHAAAAAAAAVSGSPGWYAASDSGTGSFLYSAPSGRSTSPNHRGGATGEFAPPMSPVSPTLMRIFASGGGTGPQQQHSSRVESPTTASRGGADTFAASVTAGPEEDGDELADEAVMLSEYYLLEHAISVTNYNPAAWREFGLLLFDVCEAMYQEWAATSDRATLVNFQQQSAKAISALQQAMHLWRSAAQSEVGGLGPFTTSSQRRQRHARSVLPTTHLFCKAVHLAVRSNDAARLLRMEPAPTGGSSFSVATGSLATPLSESPGASMPADVTTAAAAADEGNSGLGCGFAALDFSPATYGLWVTVAPLLVQSACKYPQVHDAVYDMCARSRLMLHQFVFSLVANFEHDFDTVFPQRAAQVHQQQQQYRLLQQQHRQQRQNSGGGGGGGGLGHTVGPRHMPPRIGSGDWGAGAPHGEPSGAVVAAARACLDVGRESLGGLPPRSRSSLDLIPRYSQDALDGMAANTGTPLSATVAVSPFDLDDGGYDSQHGRHHRQGTAPGPASIMLRRLARVGPYHAKVIEDTMRFVAFAGGGGGGSRGAPHPPLPERRALGSTAAGACPLDRELVFDPASATATTTRLSDDVGSSNSSAAALLLPPGVALPAPSWLVPVNIGTDDEGSDGSGRPVNANTATGASAGATPTDLKRVLRMRCHVSERPAAQFAWEQVLTLSLSDGYEVRFHMARERQRTTTTGGESDALCYPAPAARGDAATASRLSAQARASLLFVAPFALMEGLVAGMLAQLPLTHLRRPLVLPLGLQSFMTSMPDRPPPRTGRAWARRRREQQQQQRGRTATDPDDPTTTTTTSTTATASASAERYRDQTLAAASGPGAGLAEAAPPSSLHFLHLEYEAHTRAEEAGELAAALLASAEGGPPADGSTSGSHPFPADAAEAMARADYRESRRRHGTARRYDEALARAFDSGDAALLIRFITRCLAASSTTTTTTTMMMMPPLADGPAQQQQGRLVFLASLPRPEVHLASLRRELETVEAAHSAAVDAAAAAAEVAPDSRVRRTGVGARKPAALALALGAGAPSRAAAAERRRRCRRAILAAESPRHAPALKAAFLSAVADPSRWLECRRVYTDELAEWSAVQYLLDVHHRAAGGFFVDTGSGHIGTHGLGRYALQQQQQHRPADAAGEGAWPGDDDRFPFRTTDPCLFRLTPSLVRALPVESALNTFHAHLAQTLYAVGDFSRDLSGITAYGLEHISAVAFTDAAVAVAGDDSGCRASPVSGPDTPQHQHLTMIRAVAQSGSGEGPDCASPAVLGGAAWLPRVFSGASLRRKLACQAPLVCEPEVEVVACRRVLRELRRQRRADEADLYALATHTDGSGDGDGSPLRSEPSNLVQDDGEEDDGGAGAASQPATDSTGEASDSDASDDGDVHSRLFALTAYDAAAKLIALASDPDNLIGAARSPHSWACWAPHW